MNGDEQLNLFFDQTDRRLHQLVESVPYGLFISDERSQLHYVNDGFCRILGVHLREEVLGRHFLRELFDDPDSGEAFWAELNRRGVVNEFPVRWVRPDGKEAALVLSGRLITGERGRVVGWQGVLRDNTPAEKTLEVVQTEKDKLEQLLAFDGSELVRNLNRLVDAIVSKAVNILHAEKCSLMLYDETREELSIRGSHGLNDEVVAGTRIGLGDSIAGKVALQGRAVLVKNIEYDRDFKRCSSGTYKGRSFMSAPIILDKRLLGVLNVADKTPDGLPFTPLDLKILRSLSRMAAVAIENAELYKQLEHLSVTDPLTGLYNYRYFLGGIDEEIQRFKRGGPAFCIMMIDADEFKAYNDEFGHPAGDQFLKELSQIFQSRLRVTDKVCRYGGDEFAILLSNTGLDQALSVAEQIRASVADHAFRRPMTISLGVSEYKEPNTRVELIFKADRALYRAKQAGRNQVAK